MEQFITLHYFNADLQIGMANWKVVYLLRPQPVQLFPEVYRGKLMYRAKGSSHRISYDQIKKGLVRKSTEIRFPVPAWL